MPVNISPIDGLHFQVRNVPQGVLIEGTDGSEQIQIFDTRGRLQESFHATNGSTVLDIRMHGACFIRIQKVNQVQWHLIPRF